MLRLFDRSKFRNRARALNQGYYDIGKASDKLPPIFDGPKSSSRFALRAGLREVPGRGSYEQGTPAGSGGHLTSTPTTCVAEHAQA